METNIISSAETPESRTGKTAALPKGDEGRFSFSQLMMRTMAKDMAALSKKIQPTPVSLPARITLPAKEKEEIIRPITDPIMAKFDNKPTTDKTSAPPADLPTKEESKPAEHQEKPQTEDLTELIAKLEVPKPPSETPITAPYLPPKTAPRVPPPPIPPKSPTTQAKKPLPKNIVYLIGGFALLAAIVVGGWFAWDLFPTSQPSPTPSLSQTPSLTPTPSSNPSATPMVFTPPSPLFNMEWQEIFSLQPEQSIKTYELLLPFAGPKEAAGFTQITFKITEDNERSPNLSELSKALDINLFETITDKIDTNLYSFFIYTPSANNTSPFEDTETPGRVGLVVALKEASSEKDVWQALKQQEASLPLALKNLWLKADVAIPPTPEFLDNLYREIPIRYVNFPFSTLSIDYAIVKGYLVITTSKASMYAAIDRLLTAASAPADSISEIIKCQTLNCLAEKAKTCTPSKLSYSTELSPNLKSEFYYEIGKTESDKCAFYIKTVSYDFSDAFGAELSPETASAIKEQFKILEGTDGTCKFKINDLSAMLARWNEGSFSTGDCTVSTEGKKCVGGDFGNAECSGKYFES